MHKDSGGTYGKLRITAELRYGRGIRVGKEQVALVMKRLGIYGLPKRKLPRGAKVGKASSLDLVRRRFRPTPRLGRPEHHAFFVGATELPASVDATY